MSSDFRAADDVSPGGFGYYEHHFCVGKSSNLRKGQKRGNLGRGELSRLIADAALSADARAEEEACVGVPDSGDLAKARDGVIK